MEKPNDPRLEELLHQVLEDDPEEKPDALLNAQLKARLWQEQARRDEQPVRKIPLWYLPMVLNLASVLVGVLVVAVFFGTGFVTKIAFLMGVYVGLAGMAITWIGIRHCSWKEELVMYRFRPEKRQKGGASL